MATSLHDQQYQDPPAEPEMKPQPYQDSPSAAQSEARVRTTRLVPSTLGGQYWFDVPTMLAMLAMGAVALSFVLSLRISVSSIEDSARVTYAQVLLGLYASGIAASLLDTIVRLRTRRRAVSRGFWGWKGRGLPLLFSYILDLTFATAVSLLSPRDSSTLTMLMLAVAGARFLAHVAGRSTLLSLLVLLLPPLFLGLQFYQVIVGHRPPESFLTDLTDLLVLGSLLLMSYAIFSPLNQRMAEQAELAMALAERDQKLKESQASAEQDARRLAEQVLRLDLLQDGIRAMNSAIELDELLLMVVNNAVRVLNAEQSSIGLIDPESGELVIQCATGVDSTELHRRKFQPGIGVAGWVVLNGKPLMVQDVRRDIRYVDPYTEGIIGRTTRSMLCVPLFVERKVIGVLCVTHSQPGVLTEEDQNLLTSFAEQAALAVNKGQLLEERTRAGEELRRRGELISSLNSIGQSVLSSLEREQVLDTIISRISELSSFDEVLIYLVDEKTGEEELVATSGENGAHSEELELRKGSPVTELWNQARLSGTAQATTIEYQVPDTSSTDDSGLSAQHVTVTTHLLCVPLVNLGSPLGCILLARGGTNRFSEVERDTAEKLADATTIAIVNSGLFSRVSLQQEQTSALYSLMLKVNAASGRRQLAQVLAQELQQITAAKAAALLINDTEQARITVWATSGEWVGYDTGGVSLSAHGDHFIITVLTALHQMESPGLLMIHSAPQKAREVFKSDNCVTIPLIQSGRIYGLLVIEPGTNPPITEDIKEMVNLAVSHSTVALERAELFEQTLQSARQSSMLYSIAAEVQTSLDEGTVIQMTINGAMESLPIQSCELYMASGNSAGTGAQLRQSQASEKGDRRKEAADDDEIDDSPVPALRRAGVSVARKVKKSTLPLGPELMSVEDYPILLDVLRTPGLVTDQEVSGQEVRSEQSTSENVPGVLHRPGTQTESRPLFVLYGRLMGSEEPLGILRLTTTVPADEFVRRHATFCQTLLSHCGGALERSRLYTTTANQARMLQQRAQQLTDILNLGILSAADVPIDSLMPRIAEGIARSLGFAYVRIGDIGPESSNTEVWAYEDHAPAETKASSSHVLSLEDLGQLMKAGKPTGSDVAGVYLDEKSMAKVVPGQPNLSEGSKPRKLILMPLESTGGGTLGYILGALDPDGGLAKTTERDLLEVLSIFAQRISLIVENHRVYQQLLDSKRKVEAVVLSISDGVIVTDADLNVLISNSLADQILGVPPGGSSRGYPLAWLTSNQSMISLLQECLATSTSNITDIDLQLGREVRTYQAVVHAITAPELDVLGVVLTLRDVTVERATERAKSDFLSIVSHELRTPLNSIMGFLDIILMNKTGPLNDLQSDFLGTAKQEALVLQRLINDLLDSSQLQSGMLRMEMAPLNLSTLIARVVNQAVSRMVEDELTLVNEVPDGLLVVGDEIRLEQVFKNLLDNAAKFTNAGGEIHFEAQVQADTVVISVRDNGCGIPPAQVNDVFERFFQAENNSNKFKRGLGLGLAICKNIVDAHGGRIWLESEVGVGTTVYVELLLFAPDSDLYDFNLETGKATLSGVASDQ